MLPRTAGTKYGAILFIAANRSGGSGPLSDLLATASTVGRIDLWDIATKKIVKQIHGHIALVSVMALSPDGRTLATASCDCSIKLWDMNTGRELRTLFRENAWMYALAFSPDGNTLASGGLSSVLRLWEASSPKQVARDLEEMTLQANASRP